MTAGFAEDLPDNKLGRLEKIPSKTTIASTAADANRGTTGRGENHVEGNRRWWILIVLGIAQLMVVLDATIVNIALPGAQRDLQFADADRQWVVTGYALAFGSLLLLGGRLGDLFGRRRAFMIGLLGFAIASAIGGASATFGMLVAARVGQGVFGALLAPAALSLLTVTFTNSSERAAASGVFSAIYGGAGVVGLLLGGALTEWASWRWALYINLPFAGVALIGALVLIARDVGHQTPALDLPGTVTGTAGLFSLVYGFSHSTVNGWSDVTTVGFLTAGVILLIVFVVLQIRVPHPLLPLYIILDRTRGGAYVAIFVVGTGIFATFLFLTYYMQLVLHYSPIKAGAGFLPMVIGVILAATATPLIVIPLIGVKAAVAGGFIMSAASMATLTRIGLNSHYLSHILPGQLLLGLGVGVVLSVAFQGATAVVDRDDAGMASATLNAMQQVGGSLGTALLSTLAVTAATNYVHSRALSQVTLAQAHVVSYVTAFWCTLGIFLAGALVVAGLLPNRLPTAAHQQTVVGG
ncbi:MFS transporter [Nocardia terpenica]|uniref:MFS transporter n=1 Tax=Nocardia terpenica TaxID=455432 RepID=UPI002FE1C372